MQADEQGKAGQEFRTAKVLAHEADLPDGRTMHLALEVRTDVTLEEWLRMPRHVQRMIDEGIDGADEGQA